MLKQAAIRLLSSILILLLLGAGFFAGQSVINFFYEYLETNLIPFDPEVSMVWSMIYVCILLITLIWCWRGINKIGLLTTKPVANVQIIPILTRSLVVGFVASISYWSILQLTLIIWFPR